MYVCVSLSGILHKYMFIVVGPSNSTDVTPQDTAPAIENTALLENETVTVAGHGTEDGTTSNQTDPDDDSKTTAFDIPMEEETSESLIKSDAPSDDVENESRETWSIWRYICLRL
jgi:hypothetical protein